MDKNFTLNHRIFIDGFWKNMKDVKADVQNDKNKNVMEKFKKLSQLKKSVKKITQPTFATPLRAPTPNNLTRPSNQPKEVSKSTTEYTLNGKCPKCGSAGEDIVFKFYCSNRECDNFHE